jgi:hypothetical protein
MFRGVIKAGSSVEARFSSDFSNSGAAHLLIGLGRFAGGSETDSDTTAPGGTAKVRLEDPGEGMLEVLLDAAFESEGGRLEVLVDGESRDDEAVFGDTRWTYSVEL